jgi:hypothetical protein
LVTVEDARRLGRLEHVVGEYIPAGEAEVIELGQGDEILDQGAARICAFAQAHGSHLGKRADGLGNSLAHGFDAGDEGGGY